MQAFLIFLPRLLGVAAGWATSKLLETTGIAVDPATLSAAALVAYAAVHRTVSSKVNPGDAASRRMAAAEGEALATGTAVVPEAKH